MAAAGNEATNKIYFVGGSTNPYNYNGIGYNGEPSTADDAIWTFDIAEGTWVISKTEAEAPTMDHRGLINVNGSWVTIGGMLGVQLVTSKACSLSGLTIWSEAMESVLDTEALKKVKEILIKSQEEFR